MRLYLTTNRRHGTEQNDALELVRHLTTAIQAKEWAGPAGPVVADASIAAIARAKEERIRAAAAEMDTAFAGDLKSLMVTTDQCSHDPMQSQLRAC